MAMTRKDYIKFAEAIGSVGAIEMNMNASSISEASAINETITSIISRIGSIFEADNPNFDWDRFEAAVQKEFEETAERLP